MRILYLSPVGVLGGAERILVDILAAIREADPFAELHLVAGTDGPLIQQAEKLRVGVTLLPMPDSLAEVGDSGLIGLHPWRTVLALARRGTAAGWAAWHYANRLRRVVAAFRPQVIHSNGLKFHLLARLAGLPPVPVVWHLHDFVSLRPLMAHALRWAERKASGAIAVSQAVGRDARSVFRHLPITVVYNGIDTDLFSPGFGDSRWLDELAGLPPAPEGTIRVGLVATYARWKGQDLFLDAAARVAGHPPQSPVRFYVVGGPIYRTQGSQFSERELREQAAALGIGNRVGFIGFQPEPADIYRGLDIVVHASTRPEPFGRTIVEAMACGKPVIVTRAGGAAELFTHNHDAIGVPQGDAEALASAMRGLVDDPDHRLALAARARVTARQRFCRRRLGHDVAGIYAQVAKGEPTRVRPLNAA